MKVASICPACGRPASTKGRSECVYCGARLLPVETGTVSAAGSGTPIAVSPENLKAPPPPGPPSPPRLDAPWLRVSEAEPPARRFLRNGWVRFALAVSFILLAILGLGRFIEEQRPGPHRQAPAAR
jgi:hypothetical protein